MAVYNFDDVAMDGATQSEAAEKLSCLLRVARKFNLREVKRLAEVAEKEPLKVAFAKKAMGL